MKRLLAGLVAVAAFAVPSAPADAYECHVEHCLLPAVCRLTGACQQPPPPPAAGVCIDAPPYHVCL